MAKLVAIYHPPKDPAAFERYYFASHLPVAKKIPGLRDYDISRGPIASGNGPATVHLIATLYFDDLGAIQSALASPEGQAAAADLANFADGGVELLMFDTLKV